MERFFEDGRYYNDSECSDYDLVIEIKTKYEDYNNFRPDKYQSCLLRDKNGWHVVVCTGYEHSNKNITNPIWICGDNYIITTWSEFVPLNDNTIKLLHTDISYENYIKTLI